MKQWNRLLKLGLFIFLTRAFVNHIYGSFPRMMFAFVFLASIFFFVLFPEEMGMKSVFGKNKPLEKTSSKVQERYEQSGLSKQDIDYFRQKMAVVKTQIEEIAETIKS